jgi:hypothetical protein
LKLYIALLGFVALQELLFLSLQAKISNGLVAQQGFVKRKSLNAEHLIRIQGAEGARALNGSSKLAGKAVYPSKSNTMMNSR